MGDRPVPVNEHRQKCVFGLDSYVHGMFY